MPGSVLKHLKPKVSDIKLIFISSGSKKPRHGNTAAKELKEAGIDSVSYVPEKTAREFLIGATPLSACPFVILIKLYKDENYK